MLKSTFGEIAMKSRQRQKDILFSLIVFFSAFAVNLLIQKLFTTQTLVPMDPLLIQQVMTNLLENAAVHGVTTTRVVVSLEKRGKWARLTVCDNGRGIPEGRLHNLFDGTQSAQKGDSTRSMGIGLSVCKTVVAAHCGKIKGENIKGGGARFTVDLPLEEDEHEDQG